MCVIEPACCRLLYPCIRQVFVRNVLLYLSAKAQPSWTVGQDDFLWMYQDFLLYRVAATHHNMGVAHFSNFLLPCGNVV